MSTSQTSPAEWAAAARDRILGQARQEHWPQAVDVGRAFGDTYDAAARARAHRMRDAGELLGLWSPDEQTFYYPPFQFGRDGRPHPRLTEFLAALGGLPTYSPSEDPSGWGRMDWLVQRRRSLGELGVAEARSIDGIAPEEDRLAQGARAAVDVFLLNPDAVIAMARADSVEAQ
ncbi:MAG TPA: hypothetical protein VF292_05340 [Rhodanobacteraceae bacterium]